MSDFIAAHWMEFIFSLISTGALCFCKIIYNEMKEYKKLLEEQDESKVINLVKNELSPFTEELKKIHQDIKQEQELNKNHLDTIIRFWKFALIKLCKYYLDQGYLNPEQFEILSEFYKLYSDLGGNGQAREYYERTIQLPIKED